MNSEALAADFKRYACAKLRQNLAQIARCAALLDEREIWQRANENCNSVGNLILHLTGNLRQWILAGIAGEPFARDRAAEFAERGPLPTAGIVAALEGAASSAGRTISQLSSSDLAVVRKIRSYEVTALEAVFHVVEHFSFHAGQIIHATKTLKDADLSLYDVDGKKLSGEASVP